MRHAIFRKALCDLPEASIKAAPLPPKPRDAAEWLRASREIACAAAKPLPSQKSLAELRAFAAERSRAEAARTAEREAVLIDLKHRDLVDQHLAVFDYVGSNSTI